MDDELNDNFIIPGKETTAWSEMIDRRDEKYWFVECPECGLIHPRVVTTYWRKEPKEEGGFTPNPVEQHCIFCDATSKHFKIDRNAPFSILGEIPMPVLKSLEAVADDEEVKRKFE